MKLNEPSSSESYVDDTEVIYNRNSSIGDSSETPEEEMDDSRETTQEEIDDSSETTEEEPNGLGSTFVLMFDGRYGLYDALDAYKPNEVTSAGILTHWIDSILTYCVDDSVDEEIKLPKILFAATHGDSFTQNELDDRKAMFIEELTKIFSSNDLHEHIIYNTLFFFDARNKDDPEIQQLTKHLVDIAFEQPSWGQQMPVAWVPLELQISKMKAARMNFVTKSQLQGFNVQNGDFILTDPQFEDFLKAQHSLGKLLYFGNTV
ncbi:unnamed protein product [Mytilus edulis]|uniref:Uncharacterized protein n=1 Tax=Mytilus edulis TaxID=6550 RepID=A0A8S3S2A6_MYTED|nr:unnamed protein product [Mytilus edulis]